MRISKKMIENDYNLLGFLDMDSREDYFYIASSNPQALKYFPKDLQSKKNLDSEKISSVPFHLVNQQLLSLDQIKELIRSYPKNYQYLSNPKKKNLDLIKLALSGDGTNLSLIPKSVKQTQELVNIAMESNSLCFWDIDQEFINYDICHRFVAEHPKQFVLFLFRDKVPKEFKEDPKLFEIAINGYGPNIKHLNPQNIDLCLVALEKDPESFSLIEIVNGSSPEETKQLLLNKKRLLDLLK